MSWEDNGGFAPEVEAEAFLSHLAGDRSSFSFLAGGGSLAASGALSDNRARGSLSGYWHNLMAWNQAGQNIEIEECSGFKAVWMRGSYKLLDKFALPPSMNISVGFGQVDYYWLISDSRLATEQWEAFRKPMHEAFLKLGAEGHTHFSGAAALPGTKRHVEGRSQPIQNPNPYGEPATYSLQELTEAFGLTLPVSEREEPTDETPREVPPARGKVKKALGIVDQSLAKGSENTPVFYVSDLMEGIALKDRKNFRKDILKHPAFIAALEERSLVYVPVIGRKGGSYLAPKGSENRE